MTSPARSAAASKRFLPTFWARLAWATVLACTAATVVPVVAADGAPNPPVIVAVGDVHADFDSLIAVLQHVGLVDDGRRWSGGKTVLVQMGDYLDRGSQVRETLDFLAALPPQAQSAGGRVIVLLGNHEAMNALGILRDVSPHAFASFADGRSESRRADAYAAHVAVAEARRAAFARTDPALAIPAVYAAPEREAWMEAHPVGMIEYLEAVGSTGAYGRWLRDRPVAVQVGDDVFVHGGFNPEVAPRRIDAATDQAHKELARWDKMRAYMIDRGLATPAFTFRELLDAGRGELALVAAEARRAEPQQAPEPNGTLPVAVVRHPLAELLAVDAWSLLNENGPLWFRGFATWSSEQGRVQVDALQRRYGRVRFVVGHTPLKPPRQMARFDQRVFLIDTGISAAYRDEGGRPSALEIRNGAYTAVYLDTRTVLFDSMAAVVR